MKRLILPVFALAAAGCDPAPGDAIQGYVEGEYALLASPYAGQLQKLNVRRGDQVEAGKPLFALEQEAERAARLEAEERLKSAQARLENLRSGRRAPEVQALREAENQALAALDLSTANLAREEKLFKQGFTAKSRFDEASSARDRDRARLAEARAQLRVALLPLGRDAELKAAQGEVDAARAAVAQAAWRLEQKSVEAPSTGLVQDTFFVEGEWVPAGKPVVSLLPPGNVKARFYVPEAMLGALAPGRAVEIRCDGCAAPVPAKITYLSSQAEYTPPVLYGKENRTKLLYLVEARPSPAEGARLRPGQPVDVRLR